MPHWGFWSRHESLRTSFHSYQGTPCVQLHQQLAIALPVDDLTGQDISDQQLESFVRSEVQQPFVLEDAPLFRVRMFRLDPHDFVITFTIHHIISDGWSMGVLLRELAQAYQACQHGESVSLPPCELQYVDFAAWQRRYLSGPVLEKHLDYWRQELDGASAELDLATDYPRPQLMTFHGAQLPVAIDQELGRRLDDLCRQYECTPFMVLLAAFQTLLCRCTAQQEVCIGSPVAGRTLSSVEQVLGLFVNTVVLRARLDQDTTFLDLLQQTRAKTLHAQRTSGRGL